MNFAEEDRKGRNRGRVLAMQKPREVRVETWLSGYQYLFGSERSEATRRVQIEYLLPFRRAFGKRRVRDITALEAQAWAVKHPAQVRYLRHAWARAAAMQVADFNVFAVVALPPRRVERRRPPSELELQSILATCAVLERERAGREPPLWWASFAAMVEVAAYTGARQGGLIALRHAHVDLERSRMTVTEKGDKTRTVVLPVPAALALARAIAARPRNTRDNELPLPGSLRRYVWLWRDRTPLTNERVQKAWRQVRGEFPHGFHSLRHFCATWMAEQGVAPADIAVQLGHTDSLGRPYTGLVERVYDHPDPEEALVRVEAVLRA